MNDFDYDALQKKRIARGAYHKKNGSLFAVQKRENFAFLSAVKLDK